MTFCHTILRRVVLSLKETEERLEEAEAPQVAEKVAVPKEAVTKVVVTKVAAQKEVVTR